MSAHSLDRLIAEAAESLEKIPSPIPVGAPPKLKDARQLAERVWSVLLPETESSEGLDGRSRISALASNVERLAAREHHARCPDTVRVDAEHCVTCQHAGRGVSELAIEATPELRRSIVQDLEAALDADPAARSASEVALCYPGFRAIGTYRFAHVLWRAGAQLLARLLTEHAHAETGIDLHPGASIGPRFFIDHGTGVVVGETAVIGARVRLYQGVTIGARSVPRDQTQRLAAQKRHPTLEDEVIIYANATILGGDTVVGRGAIIGGNCWVTASVAAGARVTVGRDPVALEGLRGPAEP